MFLRKQIEKRTQEKAKVDSPFPKCSISHLMFTLHSLPPIMLLSKMYKKSTKRWLFGRCMFFLFFQFILFLLLFWPFLFLNHVRRLAREIWTALIKLCWLNCCYRCRGNWNIFCCAFLILKGRTHSPWHLACGMYFYSSSFLGSDENQTF